MNTIDNGIKEEKDKMITTPTHEGFVILNLILITKDF